MPISRPIPILAGTGPAHSRFPFPRTFESNAVVDVDGNLDAVADVDVEMDADVDKARNQAACLAVN